MTQSKKDSHSTQDDRLADFADQVLAGKISQVASNADHELLSLEETILRLSKAFPPAPLNDTSIKQMQVRLNARIKRESEMARRSLWEKWFGNSQSRPQFAMVFGAIALIVMLAIFLPGITTGSSTTATALAPSKNILALFALMAVIVILWIMRRK